MPKKHPLRRWRESFDETVTLDKLAKQLGVVKSMLSDIENWKKKPSLDLACKLAKITGIPVCDFNVELIEK